MTTCRYCKHSRWMLATNGERIKKKTYGKCSAVSKTIQTAICVAVRTNRSMIWPDTDATDCPMYEENNGPLQPIDGTEPPLGIVELG